MSNSLGKIIQFQPSLSIRPLVVIAYFPNAQSSQRSVVVSVAAESKENSLEKTLTYGENDQIWFICPKIK